jgi:hypothetical protein
MVHRPVIGMRVRINSSIVEHTEKVKGVLTCDYDQTRGNTGTLVDIVEMAPAAHTYKLYVVKLDPPNFGEWRQLSTNWFSRA